MKYSTFVILGLAFIFSMSAMRLSGQTGMQIFDMDHPDYKMDVERFCSVYFDISNPGRYGDSEKVNYRYVKFSKYQYVSRTEKHPALDFYVRADSTFSKEARFCGFDFGKLNLTADPEGTLLAMDCETETDREGFESLLQVATHRYGKPDIKEAETGEDELENILINHMVINDKDVPVYLWSLEGEYLGLFLKRSEVDSLTAEIGSCPLTVKLFRAKKEFEDLLVKVYGPEIESLIELKKFERELLGK